MKLLKIFFSFILFLSLYACSGNSETIENKKSVKDSLIFVKETDAVFKTLESVKYDAENNLFYVSNINGNPGEKDGNGFISKISFEGEIIDLNWVSGLNAPKGMGIYGDKLYVSDIDELVEISISEGKVLRKYPAKDAEFLNDVDIDKNGIVYVSDMGTGKIWYLKNGVFSIWKELGNNSKPNGLFCENNRLLIGTKTKIIAANYKTKKLKTLIDNTGNIDGLESVGNNAYIFSDWSGHIYIADIGGEKVLLLNTTKDKINAADIEFIPEKKITAVPTFYRNTVSFYKLKRD